MTVSLSGTAIVSSDLTGGEDTSTTDVTGTGVDTTNTRATIFTPTYNTLIKLGAAYSTATTDGFSIRTDRHIFLNASKTATLQANGNAVLAAANADLYAIAGKDAYLVAEADTYVGGADAVSFMAGYGSGINASAKTDGGGNPTTPDGVKELEAGITAAEVVAAVWQTGLGVLSTVKTFWQAKNVTEVSSVGLGVPVGYITATYFGPLLALYQLYSLGSWVLSIAGNVRTQKLGFWGATGILAGTPSSMAIAGAFGVHASGLNVNLLGFINTTLDGVYKAGVESMGDVSVRAGKNISALTAWDVSLGARAGKMTFQGKTVSFGNKGTPLSYSTTSSRPRSPASRR